MLCPVISYGKNVQGSRYFFEKKVGIKDCGTIPVYSVRTLKNEAAW